MGWLAGPSFLHPARRELSPDLVKEADSAFSQIGTHRDDFDVRAADGVLLRGWKVRSAKPNGKWVLVFHGVADNRAGVVGQAQLLIQAGYSVVMMDARAHGASDGPMATYGWLERNDSKAVVDALETTEHPRHLFALGESMGRALPCNPPRLNRASKRWWPKRPSLACAKHRTTMPDGNAILCWERRCWRLARGRCSIMASLRQVFRLVRFHRRKRWLPVHFRCC